MGKAGPGLAQAGAFKDAATPSDSYDGSRRGTKQASLPCGTHSVT